MTFKAGDKIKMLADCSGNKKGDVFTLKYGSRTGVEKNFLFAWDIKTRKGDGGCSCQRNWEPINTEKTWDSLECGDLLKNDKILGIRSVQGKMGEIVLFINYNTTPISAGMELAEILKNDGWRIDDPILDHQPQTLELTLDEIARKFEVEVSQVKIKKE